MKSYGEKASRATLEETPTFVGELRLSAGTAYPHPPFYLFKNLQVIM
jgi:hypothetical protein